MKIILSFTFFLFSSFLLAQNKTSDCATANILCNKNAFEQPPIFGSGFDAKEANDAPCFGAGSTGINVELNSVWYKWTCDTSGSLTFTISPSKKDDDIDFVVYELPNGIDNCAAKTVIRCMAAGDFNYLSPCMGPTGLRDGETDEYADAGCGADKNNFLKPLALEKDKTYALMVNNFTSSGNSFSLSFGGTATFKTNPTCFFVANEELNAAAAAFSISPNPSSGNFVLHYPTNSDEKPVIHLSTTNGQQIMSNLPLDTTIDIPTSLPDGLYFVTIQTACVFFVKKIILQKK